MTKGLVLVTGAGGFVGGHIARHLARRGRIVRGLARRPVAMMEGDPPIDWMIGDLLDPDVASRAVAGATAVVHSAGWVSLGPDHAEQSHEMNVVATERLLAAAIAAGVECFVYTSSLYTLAAGTSDHPADEKTPWNLDCIDSPYTRSKRAAEALVLAANGPRIRTLALCPGMVLGPRDPKPTSTTIIRTLARNPLVFMPPGGIPITDAAVLALAHERALCAGPGGERFAVVGPYVSYPEIATIVRSLVGWPKVIVNLPDRIEPLLGWSVQYTGPYLRRTWPDVSRQVVAGGFLRLHVSGARANREFGLAHPPAAQTIANTLGLGST